MNFFEHQDRARQKTTQLVFLFVLAVAGIVVGLYFASRIVLRYGMTTSTGPYVFSWWDPEAFAVVAAAGVLFIGLVSGVKTQSLRGGGSTVAEMLGGRRVLRDSADPGERRLLNVVEEIAIASGVPVPKVYVLEKENGINAFAAGYTPNDAAVAVTRGCITHLSRDELQGVIAHEFSHILNGDMRLNIRLIGILFGIFAIGIFGYVLARVGGTSRGGSRRGAPVIAIAGILLMVIGYIGTFIGRLIQSAVCRQREFLADSSAVQFTRNPRGIGGALKKIGGLVHGSRLGTPKAEQASHLFFAQGPKIQLLAGLLASHPPLAERIRRIDPTFDGKFPKVEIGERETAGPDIAAAAGLVGRQISQRGTVTAEAESIADRVGNPTAEHLALGGALLGMIPETLQAALSTPMGAACTVHALLLDKDPAERERQIGALRRSVSQDEIDAVLALREQTGTLDPAVRLPLVDLAMPALRDLPSGERDSFLRRVEALVAADQRVTLFEFAVQWMLSHRFRRDDRPADRITIRSLGPVMKELAVLLSALAHAGNPGDPNAARRAFDLGAASVVDPDRVALPFAKEGTLGFQDVGRAFDRLARSAFRVRQRVIEACAHTAFADRTVTVEEAELLRVISVALDCPLPPFLS